MPVQHSGNSSVFDLIPSSYVRPDPDVVAKQDARETARKSSDAVAGRGGKTSDEVELLKVLRADGPVGSVAVLAQRTGIAATNISTALSDLEARGLVKRKGHTFAGLDPKIEAI